MIAKYLINRSIGVFYKRSVPLWMLPHSLKEKDWPLCEEIDIMEHVGKHVINTQRSVGGNWGGEVDEKMLPFVMEVEYVRIYQ